jgi:predicted CXXCH cytochrome family protein
MASRETGKQKAARIPLDYYRRPDRLQRGKLMLALAGLAAAVGFGAWGMVRPAGHYAPGPLAAPHAIWNDRCATCHVEFTPIRGDAWAASPTSASATAERCQTCHLAPEHHAMKQPGEVAGCGSCHVDHRGSEASLLRMDDRHCTRCHKALDAHPAAPSATVALSTTAGNAASTSTGATPPESRNSVTRFDLEHHPPFRSALSDPGKLKFTHRRHLAPGMNLGPGDRFPARRWNSVLLADRDRYLPKSAVADDLIQLSCADCHQLDTSASGPVNATAMSAGGRSRPAAGAYFQPITYEAQCRGCHPLAFDPDANSEEDAAGTTGGKVLPHKLTPDQISEYLKMTYEAAYFESQPKLFDQFVPARPLPNRTRPELKQARTWVDEKVQRSATFLNGRCGECHELAGLPTQAPVAATNIPQIWLPSSRFDHSAHRAVSCQQCHQAPYLNPSSPAGVPPASSAAMVSGGEVQSALDNADVLIPKIEVCIQCHAPQTSVGSGARFDCALCHRYHGGDRRLDAAAATSRSVEHGHTLEQFLHGTEPPEH